MSKKILFMSSAKLTAISFGLLLAVFCTIGMSFTPGEEGDNVGNPNDSTYITGPRRSHWNGGGCNESDSNNNDYARTSVVTMGHGTVSIKNTTKNGSLTAVTTQTSTNVAGNEAVISWNCKKSTGGHVNNFDLTATPDDGYYFAGWSTSNTSNTGTSSANPWNIQVTIPHGDKGTAQNNEYESSSNPYPTVYYAYFGLITYVDVSFASVPEGCSYDITVGGSTQMVSASDVVKTHIAEAKLSNPVAALGYVFAGWYQVGESGTVMDITSESPTVKFSENVTLGARFISTSTPKFKNITKGVEYYGLKMATMAASANDIIIPVAEETVVDGSDLLPSDNGKYTLPAGAKLLIPYESGNTWQILPKVVTTAATLSAYKKLILMDGVDIVVSSGAQICIGGQAMAASGSASDGATGYTTGACGVLDMSRGGHLELNNGSTLYCWGFVKGQDMDQGNNTVGVGTITVNSGATVWEPFSVGDWRGGSATSSIVDTRFFPFQSYFMQNIEVPTTFWHGSSEWCYFTLNATGGPYDTQFAVIGSSNCLFKLTDAQSKVRTWYDPTTDLMCYELSGSAILDELKIKITGLPLIGTIDINSSQFDLPITSNMHLILADCTMNLTKPLIIQPGAVVEIKNNATVTLTNSIYLYDKDDWGPWVNGKYFKSRGNLTTHKNRGNGASNEFLDDAKFIIDGSFTIGSSGKLYSTAGGANIMGNDGGHLTYSSSLTGSVTSLRWYKSTTTSGDGETGTVAVNVANLCNEDESYTKAIASKTFLNIHGRWFNQTDGASAINADHTYNFTYIASGAVSGTGGTDVSPNTHNAVYAPDKTGLVAGMKWCNVVQDGTCSNIFNATQTLNETPASDIRYTYPSDSWLQLLRTETEGVYGGSDNSLYAVEGCAVSSLGSVDENCLYTIGGVKKALVDGHFVTLEKNTEDEAWHDVANPTNYYISFAGCTWHPATKYAGEEKAYIVEEGDYIWYNNDWLLVEREDPFFFDYNDQNVRRYYEYEDGAWVLASPRVRVVDAIETRDFYFINEAFTVANGKKNTTITLLKDIPMVATSLTYSAKNTTCTLDLNGHTMRGAVPYTDKNNIGGFLVIDASGSTFTITDNTTDKNGRLENICEQNQVTYTVRLVAGTLYINAGYIYAENPKQYSYGTSSVGGTATNATDVGTRCVYLSAGTTTYIQGGTIHAKSSSAAHGIFELSSKNNNTNLNISNGTIYAEAARYAYGVRARGKLNITGGLIKSRLNTSLTNGNETYMSKKKDDYTLHRYGYGVYVEPVVSATASENYGGTLTMSAGRIESYNDNYTEGQNLHTYGINFGATYTNVPAGSTAADGTYSQKCSGKGTITGGSIYVENQGLLSYGILHGGNYNSYESKSHILKISNCDITVKAYQTAYGIYANASIGSTSSSSTRNLAAMSYGDVELTNCTVYTEATVGTTAYAVYGHTTYATIFADQTEYDTSSKTNISQTRFTGEYAIGAKIKIVGGTYTAKAATTTAYAVCTNTRSKTIYGTDTKVEADRTVGGNAEGYVTLIIDGGTFIGEATTTTARAVSSGGYTTITGGTFNATAGTYYAYALYALSGKLTATNSIINATANGRVKSSDNNAYAYGALADCGIVGSGNQAWTGFTYFGEIELNNCTVTATATTYDNARGISVNATSALLTQANYEAEKTKRKWDEATTWAAYQAVFPGDNTSRAVAAKAKVTGGSLTVTAGRANAYGAFSTKTAITNTQGAMASPEMTLTNVAITSKTRTNTTAYGVYSGGSTTIDGCTITATAGDPTYKSTASGVLNVDKTTTIKNSTITATATDAAYGLEGRAEINATHGYCWHGEFDLSEAGNTIVTAEAKTKAKTAYTIFLKSAKLNIATGGAFDGDYATAASATINGGTYNAKFNTSGSAYVISLGSQQIQGDAVAQPEVLVNGGFFNGSTAEVGTAGIVGHMQLKGGYFVHPTNLATYAVAPKSVWTLPTTHEHYNPYYYKIAEHYNIVFMNGTTQLQQKDMEVGSIPAYTGTPTKDADAQYTYTFDGWSTTDGGDKLASLPAVSADATYFAHYSKTEKKYTVNVSAGEHGSVSPASVSGIGCVTASVDITATPNTGYRFDNWTLPTGVTAADGYTSESNPIHIHATASGKTITANFAAKTYTVTLDNQSATTSGAASVTATYNEAMPSIAANLPAKTGYAFGGYFSETNGGGTQYYNADGTSAHIWDVDAASPTLYAKWTSSVVETGPVLDIVDATNDGDHGTLTLNATSWPNSAAGYYINEVLYTRSGNRTIVINYAGKEPGESFVIDVKKSGAAESYSCHSYTIPRVITSNTAITEDQNWPIFVKGATLTVDNDIATGKIYVGAGAKLVINEALTAEGIYLRTTPTAAAEMLNNGSIDAQLYYTRIIDSKANYYPFGLPLDCDIEDVAMSDGSARPKYGSGWLLRWYDESSRAANGGATNNMTSKEGDPADFPTKIVGGRGYEMFSASNYYREFYFPIDHSQLESTVPVSYTENGAAGEKHAGWNVLVSPWTWTHNQISKPENITVCWLEGNTWGEQDNPDVIPPSKPFAYQASPGQSIVSFTGTNIAAARRRVTAAEEPTRIQWIRLDVKDVNGEGDQTSIYSHPTRYEQTYKTGIDVAKQALTSTHAILYSSHAYGDMAFAGVADAQLEQGVPLTVYSPSAQELTFSLRDNDWLNRMESVWLIDKEEGMRIDLLNGYYTFNASEGTTRGRFFIQGQFKVPQVATDIQNGAGIEEGARKVLIDQKIYIEVHGRLYDATGKIVSK